MNVLKKKKRTALAKPSIPPVAERVYTGPLPKHKKYRDDLILIAVADAPDAEQFPKCNPAGIPPETFYAFDTGKKRCAHMVSYDAHGVGIAWDTDRDGRYFLRVGRDLLAPRYIEYSYDYANAEKAGEHWSHSHPNYRGSLSGKLDVGAYKDYSSPRTRADARRKPLSATKRIGGTTKPSAARKPLRKSLGGGATTTAHMEGGAVLDQAAEKAAESMTQGFGKKKLRKAK